MARIPLKWMGLAEDAIELDVFDAEDEQQDPFIFSLSLIADAHFAEANLSREELLALRDAIEGLLDKAGA